MVVGVADNVKNNGLTEQSDPEMYTLRRNVPGDWSGNRLIVVVDSVMPASTIEPWVRSEVASIDRTVPANMEPLNQTISRMVDRPRFETTLLGFFALTGLVLSVVGLYGLIAFMTTQRTHEIGVRMALGATRANILRLIADDGLRMVVVGLALGLGTSLVVSRLLKALLFQISAYDPLTYIVVPVLLSLVALIAILIPARAGMRVEPSVTLRAE
jgi:putative ABC transport system permease protein